MKFTAQEEYGLRCVLQVVRSLRARGGPGSEVTAEEPLTVAEIARLEGLTNQYAGKLLAILVKAGILESVRGRKGGVRMTRPADAVTLAEVLRALGGAFYEHETCERFTGDRKFCVHTNDCAIRSLWSGLQTMIDRVLSKTMLADLCSNESAMTRWMHADEDVYESFQPIQDLVASPNRQDPSRER